MVAVQLRSPAWATVRAVAVEFVRQLAVVLLGAYIYFRVRGLTESDFSVAREHGLDILAFEQRLGLDLETTMQGVILDHDWLITLANWVYMFGHWPVIIPTLVWLYAARRGRFLLLRNAMFISGAIGLVIFATYAVAPPRLVDVGVVDTVTERSNSYRVLQPPDLVNQYAALPSLHFGWNLILAIVLFGATRSIAVRTFAVLSPVAMGLAVVLTGNHYLVDGLLGGLLALFGLAVSSVLTPRLVRFDGRLRQRLKQRRVVHDQPVDPPADQPPGRRLVGDRPGEDQAVAAPEVPHQPRREQPLVQDDPVDGDPRRHPAQQPELEAVACRPQRPGAEAFRAAAQQPPRLR